MSVYLTTEEIAGRWRCQAEAVADAIRSGELRAIKVAGRWLVSPDDLATYEKARANVTPVAKRTRRPRPRRGAA